MARVAARKIGLGAVLVVVFLSVSTLAAAQQEGCPGTSTLSGNWPYPPDWCCTFVVTADQATVDPGATATFTIERPCPGATCTATSNSGCGANKFTCSVSEDGSKATVTVAANACAAFKITVSIDCPAKGLVQADSGYVRINNKGQGGAWAQLSNSCSWECRTCQGFSHVDRCTPGAINYQAVDYWNSLGAPEGCNPGAGDAGRFKIASPIGHTQPWWTQCCTATGLYGCIVESTPPPCHTDPCTNEGPWGEWYRAWWGLYEWRCGCN